MVENNCQIIHCIINPVIAKAMGTFFGILVFCKRNNSTFEWITIKIHVCEKVSCINGFMGISNLIIYLVPYDFEKKYIGSLPRAFKVSSSPTKNVTI